MPAGKAREMGLGPLHAVSRAEARVTAAAARKLETEGIDPIEARPAEMALKHVSEAEEAAKPVTFRDAAGRYIKSHSAS